MQVRLLSGIGIASLVALLFLGADSPSAEERLTQHRNLGKAFYENPTTGVEAVAEFKAALDLAPNSNREKLNYGLALLRAGKSAEGVAQLKDVQQRDPKLPHTWFNLGIAYKRAGDTRNAIAQFERMIQLVPDEAIAHYQLGALYKIENRIDDARREFERAAQLDPQLAASQFQLYNLYRQTGHPVEAAHALEIFQRLKKETENAAVPEDVDWCPYAEIYDPPASGTPSPTIPATYEDHFLSPATGIAAIDSTGAGDTDLLAWSAQGVSLYRKAAGHPADAGLSSLRGVISVAPGDFDNDGLTDLCILTQTGPLLYKNVKGRFTPFPTTLPHRRFERALWIDYDHDYDLDLMLLGDSPALLRNQGKAGFADRTPDFPFAAGHPTQAQKLRTVPDSKAFDVAVFYRDRPAVLYRDQLGGHYTSSAYPSNPVDSTIEADFDNDGRPDRARILPDGRVQVSFNRSQSNRRWIRVRLEGVKSLKLAEDAEVEVKAGTLYRKQSYHGVPLLFDAGDFPTVDVVRITWPNGLIQNEVKQATNHSYSYKEAQRLSGSCPMIWTWDGQKIQFITDVLGVAPLGASDGEGTYFPVDHDEYVSIPGSKLAPADGGYDIRVTEELSEVSYIDQIELSAVDHRAGTEIFTNEKFKGPPYPDFRLFEVEKRVYPVSARGDGRDVLSKLLARDQKYPDQFPRSELGVAEPHTLELDFAHAAPTGQAVLLLNGWVDWPDGSTFRAASQERKGGLVMPYLQMQDAHGQWVTVNEDMGMPAGKPKTIAVDLHFISPSRKLRIVTDLCVYWDEIFLSDGPSTAQANLTPIPLTSANLHFRGFSEARIHPERKQPDTFLYDRTSPTSFWNPTAGLYTRYGGVRDLLTRVDDRYVIMGSGDELRLRFDTHALLPVPQGWTRDFLLKVDGWAKDRDPNTAFSTSVDPLPFHGMSRYPYPATEHFPADAAHQNYRSEFNTRPALNLLPPLSRAGPRPAIPNDRSSSLPERSPE
ncbi:MAG TPA: tetratricopeptide repeat protein [Bryobacteraceae bacterium]|nr:tetratricopeptide repeat protein [Bryobacteraceae bacterium]